MARRVCLLTVLSGNLLQEMYNLLPCLLTQQTEIPLLQEFQCSFKREGYS